MIMHIEELSKKMALVHALRRTALNRERERLGQMLIPVPIMAYILAITTMFICRSLT